MTNLNKSILDSYHDDYARDGAVALRQVISTKWVERLREGVEENLREPGRYARFYTPEGWLGFFGDCLVAIAAYREFAFESGIGSIAAPCAQP